MRQPFYLCAAILAVSLSVSAQDNGQTGQYQGTSSPPPDDTIITQSAPSPVEQKPSPARHASGQVAGFAPVSGSDQDRDNQLPQPISSTPDDGTVQIAPPDQSRGSNAAQLEMTDRRYLNDPDGDIVHPIGRPGELIEGTTIRARLMDRLSTSSSQSGDAFRAQVASDVLQNGQVLIPAGAEIDGLVVQATTGHVGSHATLLLRPESVVLADGQRFKLYALVTGAPGSNTRVAGEGVISPGSRVKKDGIEYGGTVGVGVVTGAILGGPAGALAGGLVGAGVITVHLLADQPQATLDTGTVLLFSLSEPLDLVQAGTSPGN